MKKNRSIATCKNPQGQEMPYLKYKESQKW